MPLLPAWINPLQCPDIDPEPGDAPAPGPDRLLDYLFAPEADRTAEAFVARYREIPAPAGVLVIVPKESTILEKLVWPLRNAKGSYALANFIGCISLCGMVGEMVALLLWDISKVHLQTHPMTKAEQEDFFGSSFEKLGQERRVRILHTLNLIDDDARHAFDSLRQIRRSYLHFLSKTHAQAPSDALLAYEAALKLVSVVLGIASGPEGTVAVRPDLMAYLTEKGLVTPDEPSESS